MHHHQLPSKRAWGLFALILLSASLILWAAPAEQTLGSGITSVYLHVSLIWAGMTGLVVAELLGLVLLITGRDSLQSWTLHIAWIGLAFYAAGFAMSVLASIVNWGGVFWQEPRNVTAFNVMGLTLIVQIVIGWLPQPRLRGLLHMLPAGFLIYATLITPLVLHPGSAARSSPSLAIQATFLSLFFLCALAAAWLVWHWSRPTPKPR